MHYRGIKSAFGKIIKHPIEHVLNILVIAIISSILGGTLLITQYSETWHNNSLTFPQIMVYLDQNVTTASVGRLEAAITKAAPGLIKNYRFISKDEAFAELKNDSQLKQITSQTINSGDNPLPNLLIINPTTANPTRLHTLTNKIMTMKMVENIDMDTSYANKINDMVNFVKKISGFLQILFTVVIVLVIYNLIRLQILLKRDEITIARLIGASDSFIMRPLAYYAVIQIILSTILAYFLVNWFIDFLNRLFLHFNSLFGQTFLLKHLMLSQVGQMLFILIIFTIFTVFVAVRWIFRNNYTQ